MLNRFLLCAPLLYICLLMVVDPEGFAGLLDNVVQAMWNFQQRATGQEWNAALAGAGKTPLSKAGRNGLRCAGLVLSTIVFLALTVLT